jgi:hypothetical protein
MLVTPRKPGTKRSTDAQGSVQPAAARLELLDPHVAREPGIVSANLLDQALGALAPEASPSRPVALERSEDDVAAHTVRCCNVEDVRVLCRVHSGMRQT